MKKSSILTMAIIGFVSLNTFAQTNQPTNNKANFEAKKQEFLQKRVAIESESHQGRIDILQKADSCIKSAKTREDYKACETTEKQSRETLKEKTKAESETLKTEVQSFKEQRKTEMEKRKELRNNQK